MEKTYKWEVTPTTWPVAIRNCPKCGNSSVYECSGNFRVNANHNSIDVWLIYQCNKCNNTWNLEILSRTNVKAIDKELYHKFLANDRELAKHYAFDPATLSKSKAIISYENIEYDVVGDLFQYNELKASCALEILCSWVFELRLDKLLVKQLVLSREQIKKLSDAEKIISTNGKNITKIKLKDSLRLILKP